MRLSIHIEPVEAYEYYRLTPDNALCPNGGPHPMDPDEIALQLRSIMRDKEATKAVADALERLAEQEKLSPEERRLAALEARIAELESLVSGLTAVVDVNVLQRTGLD